MRKSRQPGRSHLEALTRLGTTIGVLGISEAAVIGRIEHLGMPRRVTLDADAPRLAIRFDSATALSVRPATTRLVDVQVVQDRRDLVEVELAIGTRSLAEDAALVGGAANELASRLRLLGGGRCDALARSSEGTWIASVITASHSDLAAGVVPLIALAQEIGVPGVHRMLLENIHLELGGAGSWASVACDGDELLPELTIEYRDVAWTRVVELTNTLRPGTKSGTMWGVLAGAFDADQAAAMAIEYRGGRAPNVRVSVAPRA
jgi:hypothetical protein